MKKADKDLKTSSSTDQTLPRKFRPASPVLDEAAILAQLAIQLSPLHSNHPTRSASVMAIVDAYDRQLPRGPFLQVVGRAVNLNEKIRQMEILRSMQLELEVNEHTREAIVARLINALQEKFKEAEEFRQGLYRDISYIEQTGVGRNTD